MSREKHIEEMAKVIINTKNDVKVWERLKTDEDIAEAFYNAGYRKASEVALEAFEWLEEKGFLNIEVWAIQDVKDELKKKYESEKDNA